MQPAMCNMAAKTQTRWKNPFVILSCCLVVVIICLVAALGVVVHRLHSLDTQNEPIQNCPTKVASPPTPHGILQEHTGIFDDLTTDEIIAVRDFMLAKKELNVTPFEQATLSSNYIYLIELQPPTKDAALEHLDNNGPKPIRQAKVVVKRGGDNVPVIQEYFVEPVDKPARYRKSPKSVPFHKANHDAIQIDIVDKVLIQMSKKLHNLMVESFDGYSYVNCTSRCLTWTNSQPGALESGQHKLWVIFTRDIPGMYIHPVGFQVLVDTPGTDQSLWKVEKIYYNGKTFDSAESLLTAYKQGFKIFVKAPTGKEALYSTYQQRGDPLPATPKRGPRLYEPDGKRFTVQGRHVEYMAWSFDFRARSTTGIQVFNIKFAGKRIIYEISLQEAAAFYSGHSPFQLYTDYLDSGWGMGSATFELVPGIDCPDTAVFIDVVHHVDTPRPRRHKNAVCIFEFNTGITLRRHFDNDFNGGYKFYGGMVSNALVLRSILTPYNYDYIFDYVFYNNGVIETRVATSGYLQTIFWTSEESPYGNQVHKTVAGSVHDHMLNYKVDLDVAGRKNSYETVDVEIETIKDPWYPDVNRTLKVVHRRSKTTEKEALYKMNFDHPKYLNIYNKERLTSTGNQPGYRIQINSALKELYPESLPFIRSAKWSLHQMVVTKYKENETCSSSIFNQADPYDPDLDFETFYADDENITQEDLVAWVTIGVMHVPHTEDVPNTATAGNTASFFLRPYNYFEEDPSVRSRDAILIEPKEKFSGIKVNRFGTPEGPKCVPEETPLDYTGTYNFD